MKISFTVNKGGVGKTTSICAIAQVLAVAGYKVLIIDHDPQGNTSRIFGVTEDIEGLDYELMYCSRVDEQTMRTFVQEANFENIDIIPSSKQMLMMDYKLYDAIKENGAAGLYFKRNLELIEKDYDFILMDNAPKIDFISKSSISAADKVLIPINTDNFSFEGITVTTNTVEEMNDRYNLEVKFGGIFMTRVKGRTNLFKDLFTGYQQMYEDYFLPVAIRDCNAVAEANTAFVPLYKYSKKCTAFIDYVELIGTLNIMDKKHYNKVVEMFTE